MRRVSLKNPKAPRPHLEGKQQKLYERLMALPTGPHLRKLLGSFRKK